MIGKKISEWSRGGNEIVTTLNYEKRGKAKEPKPVYRFFCNGQDVTKSQKLFLLLQFAKGKIGIDDIHSKTGVGKNALYRWFKQFGYGYSQVENNGADPNSSMGQAHRTLTPANVQFPFDALEKWAKEHPAESMLASSPVKVQIEASLESSLYEDELD